MDSEGNMNFETKLKGYVTETIIECILSDAGYKVLRTGIEKRVLDPVQTDRVITSTVNEPEQETQDGRIKMPDTITKMPDFLVLGGGMTQLLEVKYRCDWETERLKLAQKLMSQAQIFPEAAVVVCVGKQQITTEPSLSSRHKVWSSHHLRVIQPRIVDGVLHHRNKVSSVPIAECQWEQLELIQNQFPALNLRLEDKTLHKAANLIADIERSIRRVNKEIRREDAAAAD